MICALSPFGPHYARAIQTLGILDPKSLISWGGIAAIALIVFIETGLFVGFVLPGDSLLIVAGILASGKDPPFSVQWVILFAAIAAVAGDQLGYHIGLTLGGNLANRYQRFRKYIERAQTFFERHGAKTITIARFVPVVRTFAPAVAGAAKMRYQRFIAYNIVGGIGWVIATTIAGFLLGSLIPNLDQYLLLIIAVVVLVSLLPWLIELKRNWQGVVSSVKGT